MISVFHSLVSECVGVSSAGLAKSGSSSILSQCAECIMLSQCDFVWVFCGLSERVFILLLYVYLAYVGRIESMSALVLLCQSVLVATHKD
jgi:hypothetical protein